jgi:hypothetical protein
VSNDPNAKTQEQHRREPLVRSDLLPQLLDLAARISAFAPLVSNILRVGFVIDAHVVQQELRWRLGRRKQSDARTRLHEAIASGIVIPFAPAFLDCEIEEHVADIAEETVVGVEDVQREWQDFRKLLHFYSPKQPAELGGRGPVDPDDLPYVAVANELGLPIYSQDHHYREMQAPVISVVIDATAQAYARSSSVQLAVMMGSGVTSTLSFEAIAAAFRAIQRLAKCFGELHPGVQIAIFSCGILAFLHPKSRAKLVSIWDWAKQNAPVLLQKLSDVAIQTTEAYNSQTNSHKQLRECIPIMRKRSALMHARTVCLAARTPLSLTEIEKRIRTDGYITRARNFGAYLRRVLLSSGQFQELDSGLWEMAA